MVFTDGGFVWSFESDGAVCIGGMALARALRLGGGSGDCKIASFVDTRLGWIWTGPGGGVAGLLALSAPATTWVAGAVRIGWHGWRVSGAGHPLASGCGAGVCWRTAGGHPLRCSSGDGGDCGGEKDRAISWTWKGARSCGG
jgi:hypothetical protein